jgi:hypothetical protein
LTKKLNSKKNIWTLTPFLGAILFVIVYFIASLYYPGGSQVDKNHNGFSWANNYWCNLLNENAFNGQKNTAKPIAILGMFVLCFTLSIFWFLFPKQMNIRKSLKLIIQISGILAMTIALFLFTDIYHDLVINLATFFAIPAILGTFIGLYKTKWYSLFGFGMLNLLLVGLNNYVYYNIELIIYLPIIQKITFASFLIWVCCITIKLYQTQHLIEEK